MAPDAHGPSKVCVAKIGAAHGVRGEVRLWSFTEDPSAIADYGPLQSADGRVFEIETLRQAKDCFVARFKGIGDRNAAERLVHVELFVPRERLPPPGDDEFYFADLIGLPAVDATGNAMGTVQAVHNFGAGDILEIRRPTGGDGVLLPFSAAAVPQVDIAGGRIVVDAALFAEAATPGKPDGG